MNLTRTFKKISDAYYHGKRFVIAKGGTRASKTFSILQLLYIIAKAGKPRIIHIVSHSTPHLKDGAIADFEKILLANGENISRIRTQNPNTYRIKKSIIKFIGFDNPGKALGAARDILFVNEANQMLFEIVHHLFQRTAECIFIDYNPAREFWVNTEGILQRPDAGVVTVTYKDNIENLTVGQITDLLDAKKRHDESILKGTKGYWYNWWRVYGMGLDGQTDGVVFDNWEEGEFDHSCPYLYGMDYGFHPDPLALIKVAVDDRKKNIYVKELLYTNKMKLSEIVDYFSVNIGYEELIVCDTNEPRTTDYLYGAGFNITKARKGLIKDDIRDMMDYKIIVDPESHNIKSNLINYIWNDKRSGIPIDDHNHAIDAIRYGWRRLVRTYDIFA